MKKKRPSKAITGGGKSPARALLNYFRDQYFINIEAHYPVVWGRDMKIMKDLLEIYPEVLLKQYIEVYFTIKDSFLLQNGYNVIFLKGQIPKIQMHLRALATNQEQINPDAKVINWAANSISDTGEDF